MTSRTVRRSADWNAVAAGTTPAYSRKVEAEAPLSQSVKEALVRVLASNGFTRNERPSRFLRFLVEKQLDGEGSDLKESVIGVEVFGRDPG